MGISVEETEETPAGLRKKSKESKFRKRSGRPRGHAGGGTDVRGKT